MGDTSIQWTDKTWNPTRGCSRVSPGCLNCYAESLAGRYSAYGTKPDSPFTGFVTKVNGHASWTGKLGLIEDKLQDPLSWRKPCRVFVNSMSDLFHENLSDEEIDRVFAVMALCPQHTFQVLTKRADRMREYFSATVEFNGRQWPAALWRLTLDANLRDKTTRQIGDQPWPLPNVWLGVSVESPAYIERVQFLMETPAAVRFVSYEPALEGVDWEPWVKPGFDGRRIDWLIVGGESGPDARPFNPDWARSSIEQCSRYKVPCFMKQFGSKWAKKQNLQPDQWEHVDSHAGDPEQWPEWARVREFPASRSGRGAVRSALGDVAATEQGGHLHGI